MSIDPARHGWFFKDIRFIWSDTLAMGLSPANDPPKLELKNLINIFFKKL